MRLFILVSLLISQVLAELESAHGAVVGEMHLYEPQIILNLTPKEATELQDKQGEMIHLEIASRGILMTATLVRIRGRSAIFEFKDNIDFLKEGDRIFISENEAKPYFPVSVAGLSQYFIGGDDRVDFDYLHQQVNVNSKVFKFRNKSDSVKLRGQLNRGHYDSGVFIGFAKEFSKSDSTDSESDGQDISFGGVLSIGQRFFLGGAYRISEFSSSDNFDSENASLGIPTMTLGLAHETFGIGFEVIPKTNYDVQSISKTTDEPFDYTSSIWGRVGLEGWFFSSETTTLFFTLHYTDPPNRRIREETKTKDMIYLNLGWQLRHTPISIYDFRFAWNNAALVHSEPIGLLTPIMLSASYYYRLMRHIELSIGAQLGYASDKMDDIKFDLSTFAVVAGASYVVNQGL